MMRLLHKCDLFRVVQDEENHLTPATPHGVAVSIATALLLVFLVVGEVRNYWGGHKSCHITPAAFKSTLSSEAQREVDTLQFSVSLPFLPCDRLATETVSGAGHDAKVEQQAQVSFFHLPYGSFAADTSHLHAMGERPPSPEERGCHVAGITPLSQTRASFNIIVKDYKPEESQRLRPSFAIHEFYVGHQYKDWGVPQIRRGTVQPLAGMHADYRIDHPYFLQFYLQLIQTTVDLPGKEDRFGYQYTALYSMVQYNGKGLAPGLYFAYQPSSYSMDCSVTYDTVSHFVVNLCAVVGGVYTVAGIVEAGLQWLARERRLRELSAQNQRHAAALQSGKEVNGATDSGL